MLLPSPRSSGKAFPKRRQGRPTSLFVLRATLQKRRMHDLNRTDSLLWSRCHFGLPAPSIDNLRKLQRPCFEDTLPPPVPSAAFSGDKATFSEHRFRSIMLNARRHAE
mmetsp:Transcript_56759/g.162893  ORF Transcript_56759/g.162893 Transcript_56759/m.162893 type:complete len:108 (+) Transcript_56759:1131-1454(+)